MSSRGSCKTRTRCMYRDAAVTETALQCFCCTLRDLADERPRAAKSILFRLYGTTMPACPMPVNCLIPRFCWDRKQNSAQTRPCSPPATSKAASIAKSTTIAILNRAIATKLCFQSASSLSSCARQTQARCYTTECKMLPKRMHH
jgi:hypothetical protein